MGTVIIVLGIFAIVGLGIAVLLVITSRPHKSAGSMQEGNAVSENDTPEGGNQDIQETPAGTVDSETAKSAPVPKTRVTEEPVPDKQAKKGNLIAYYLKGRELGFKFKELQALRDLAIHFGISDPNTLLWFPKRLDECLRRAVVQGFEEGLLDNPEAADLLNKVFTYRMSVEKDRPKYKRGIDSTRTVPPGQNLKIMVPSVGVFYSRVAENFRNYLYIDLPHGRRHASTVDWANRKIEVYFWRKPDGLYYFESEVSNEPLKTELQPLLRIGHSDTLVRTQKRGSIRVSVMGEGHIVPLSRIEEADEDPHPGKGWLCKVIDISETGAAILVRGRVKPGKLAKLHVMLGELPVVMCGEIKAVNAHPGRGVSLLHLEAIPLSKGMRVRVVAYVLGLLTAHVPAVTAQRGASDSGADPTIDPDSAKPESEKSPGSTSDSEGTQTPSAEPRTAEDIPVDMRSPLYETNLEHLFPEEGPDRLVGKTTFKKEGT